jgi:site-specific DNA-methyltransferase (adenine-specific)
MKVEIGNATLYLGDCLEVLRGMPDNSVDSVCCDPPYGLSFMGKKWDYDVPSVEVWAECLRVLKPGGHLLAFAGTRTQHRMAVRIEDAGFEIRDMIAWVYGSGFPKSHDVSKAIDKQAGAERTDALAGGHRGIASDDVQTDGYKAVKDAIGHGVGCGTASRGTPVTDAAQQWQGWGTALKPALEPITVARKPLMGTVADNVLEHGTGALNIDGCRVGVETIKHSQDRQSFQKWKELDGRKPKEVENPLPTFHTGRWPANLIHDGSDEVTGLFPVTTSGGGEKHPKAKSTFMASTEREAYKGTSIGGDTGSAARFFYCAKSSTRDRDEGLEGMPLHDF